MKKTNKKLALRKQVVATLGKKQLNAIAGGNIATIGLAFGTDDCIARTTMCDPELAGQGGRSY